MPVLVPLDRAVDSPFQGRRHYDPAAIAELAAREFVEGPAPGDGAAQPAEQESGPPDRGEESAASQSVALRGVVVAESLAGGPAGDEATRRDENGGSGISRLATASAQREVSA